MIRLIPRRTLGLLACLALLALTAVGCGSSNKKSSNSTSTPSSTSTSGGGKKTITPKTVGIVSNFLASPISRQNQAAILAACKAMGGDVPQDSLIAGKFTEDETEIGRQIAKVLVQNVTNARIGEIKSSFTAGVLRAKGLREVVAGSGANGAKLVASVEPNLTNLVPETTKGITDMLTAHPDINAIYSVFDTYVQPGLPTLRAKTNNKVKMFAVYLTPVTYDAMKTKTALGGVANIDLPKTGIVAIDQLVNYFEKGQAIDPNAMQKTPLTFTLVTPKHLPASANALNSPETLLPPFAAKWKSEYQLPGA
jgi:hypothetical protein